MSTRERADTAFNRAAAVLPPAHLGCLIVGRHVSCIDGVPRAPVPRANQGVVFNGEAGVLPTRARLDCEMIASIDDALDTLKRRIVAEYREMPGLALTAVQAQRLWGCDAVTCQEVSTALIQAGVLRWSIEGLLVRRV